MQTNFEQSRSDNASADTVPPDIQQILDRARAKLEDAAPEDRDEMINLMEDIQDAVQNNQLEKARSFSKEMDDILLYIG